MGLDWRLDGMTAVILSCPEDSSREDQVRKVPASMTVQKLKGLIQRLYKVSSSDQTLSYQSKEVSRKGVRDGRCGWRGCEMGGVAGGGMPTPYNTHTRQLLWREMGHHTHTRQLLITH